MVPLTCKAVVALMVGPVMAPVTPRLLLRVAAPVTAKVPPRVVLPVPTVKFRPAPMVRVLLTVVAAFNVNVVPTNDTLFQKVQTPLNVPDPCTVIAALSVVLLLKVLNLVAQL